MLTSIQKGELIKKGAEASVYHASWYDLPCVFKERVPKGYRHPVLDQELRLTRTRREARIIHQVKVTGVRVPYIYHMDLASCSLLMEFMEGDMLRDALRAAVAAEDIPRLGAMLREFGTLVGRIHGKGFIHGDLTTSNVIVQKTSPGDPEEEQGFKLVFIDFGLGFKSKEFEDKGVDFHVLLEAFESTHSEILEMKEEIISAYQEAYPEGAKEVLKKSEEIERRGRYR